LVSYTATIHQTCESIIRINKSIPNRAAPIFTYIMLQSDRMWKYKTVPIVRNIAVDTQKCIILVRGALYAVCKSIIKLSEYITILSTSSMISHGMF